MQVNNCRAWIEHSGHVLTVIEGIEKKGDSWVYRINIPGGAVSAHDTTPECTALRELFEETYDVSKGSMLPFNYGDIVCNDIKFGIVSQHDIHMLIYKWKLTRDTAIDKIVFFNNKETHGMLWLPIKKMKKALFCAGSIHTINGNKILFTNFSKDIIRVSVNRNVRRIKDATTRNENGIIRKHNTRKIVA